MCGDSARTRRSSSSGGRSSRASRSAGPIFSAYVTPSPDCGVKSAVAAARSSSSSRGELGRRARRPPRRRRRRRSGTRACAAIGPASSSFTVSWIVTPVSLVAGHDRALDRRGAAPARQQRRVDVQPERAVEQRLGDQQAVGARRPRCRRLEDRGRRRAARAGGPGSRAARRRSFAGGAASCRPRPRGRSGRVSRYAISCCAASRSSTSAPNGAVAATAIRRRLPRREPAAAAGARAPRGAPPASSGRGSARRRGGRARAATTRARQALELELNGFPSSSVRLERHAARGARPAHDALERQAALVVGSRRSSERSTITRVDERVGSSLSSGWNTNTRRRMPTWVAASPTPVGVVHEPAHPLDEPARARRRRPRPRWRRMRSTGSRYWRICASASAARSRLGFGSCSTPRDRVVVTWPCRARDRVGHARRESSGVEQALSDCGSTSTTAVSPACRIAGAAAASSCAARAASAPRLGRSSRRAERGGARAGAGAAPGRAARPSLRGPPAAPPAAPAASCSVGPGDEDAHEVAERRVAELAAALELAGEEAARRRGARRARAAARRAGRSGRGRARARPGRCAPRAA